MEVKEITRIANRLNHPSSLETMQWVEAMSTCAIEGNEFAKHLIGLWENDRRRFIIELAQFVWEYDESRGQV